MRSPPSPTCRPTRQNAYYERALALAKDLFFPRVSALVGWAGAKQRLGLDEEALDYALQALVLARRVGFRRHEGRTLAVLAALWHDRGKPEQADEYALLALDSHRGTGHRLGEARTLALLGRLEHARGRPDAALRRWQSARELFEGIGAPVPDELAVSLRRA
jgi:tetratricopeptide (TPR) repeat protein